MTPPTTTISMAGARRALARFPRARRASPANLADRETSNNIVDSAYDEHPHLAHPDRKVHVRGDEPPLGR